MRSGYIRTAVQSAFVVLAAYGAGLYLTAIFHPESSRAGAVWSAASGIVVLQATPHETLTSAILRLLGTLIGAIIGAAYLYVFAFGFIGMTIAVGVTVFLCQLAHVPDNGRLAAITVVIVLALSAAMPALNPLVNAALRFGESCVGAAIAMLAVLLWPKAGNTT